jgi:transcriptional regulator NrdR family protein
MKCPECGAWSLVKETKESPTFGYRRRRECANYHKFTTQEILVPQEAITEERRKNIPQSWCYRTCEVYGRSQVVDGKLLEKLHKQAIKQTYEEAPI